MPKAVGETVMQILVMAMGSANELDYCNILLKELEYISLEEYENFYQKIEEIKKMLNSLIVKLKGTK